MKVTAYHAYRGWFPDPDVYENVAACDYGTGALRLTYLDGQQQRIRISDLSRLVVE